MRGFAALARKELLEQRRTWRLMGMTGVFTVLALMIIVVPLIIAMVSGDERNADDARGLLLAFGLSMQTLGSLVAIIVAMGLLANERSAGTAGMTLAKPVTRASFVAVKHVALIITLFVALFLSAGIAYALALVFFGDPGFPSYLGYMAGIGVWMAFMGSITLFWSGIFRRQVVAAGVAAIILFAQFPLVAIPNSEKFWPINTPTWAGSHFNSEGIGEPAQDWWPTLPITLAGTALLGVGAWAVFRRQEL